MHSGLENRSQTKKVTMLFIGFCVVLAIEFLDQLYQFERKSGYRVESGGKRTTLKYEKLGKRSSTSFFTFDIDCLDVDDDTCEKAKKESKELAQNLERIFDLKAEIKMLIRFISYCSTECSNDTIARTGPTSYFAMLEKPSILYPQSLVKQISSNLGNLALSKYDAIINFNADSRDNEFRFYFESYEDASSTDRYSFKFIVTHELMHGLGLVTSFDEYLNTTKVLQAQKSDSDRSNIKLDSNSRMLSPTPNVNTLSKRDVSFVPKNRVRSEYSFQFINLFDTFLVDDRTNSSFESIFMEYFYGKHTPLPIQTIYQASSLYKASTLRYAVVFDTGKERFPVDTTFRDFNSGSTMSHLDPNLGSGALDELMWSIASHKRLSDLEGYNISPLGYYQLSILDSMGYKIKIDLKTIPKALSGCPIKENWMLPIMLLAILVN
eukprot:NODE_886_length_3442_cov_0.414897.p1 type:complete len:436 gc:universal NODE_886_length_3442_cov_0.414897:2703-1396(-)